MALDPSIALKTEVVNPSVTIGSFLDLGRKKLAYERDQQTFDADVAQRRAESSSAQSSAAVNAATIKPRISQQESAASTAQSQAGTAAAQMSDAQLANLRNHVGNVTQQMTTLLQDPQISRAKIIQSISDAGLNQNAPTAAIIQSLQGLPDTNDPEALKGFVKQGLIRAQSLSTHLDAITPKPALVPTQQGTQPFNTNANAPGGIGPIGPAMAPPNQLVTTTSGGTAIGNAATGTVKDFAPSAGPQMNFPQGETAQTQQALQAERDAAKGVALNAPQMRDINRSIREEIDKGNLTTGRAGAVVQDLKSRFGFKVDNEGATDYNVLGKMLERAALTASQGMGPHTNAGLESQIRANGSLDYTLPALRKIASLNDALSAGSTMYQQGLEGAIQRGGGVFAKRKFDQDWSAAMLPTGGVNGVQALRLKNAVDSGDQKEITAVLGEVGGRGSKGANALLTKLRQLTTLSGP